jgi:molybdopterin-guanine dinucleotide biosynthesis protein A
VPRHDGRQSLTATPAAPKKRRSPGRKCRNCDSPFTPRREWQEFCQDDCRKEFHRAGGVSIGRLQPIIAEMVAAAIKPHVEELRQLREQIDAKLHRALNI